MARPRAKTPARRYHVSGQSVVTIDGRDFYLGRHDSPEALARYAVLIAQYQRNGCRLPDDFDPQSIRDQAAIILGEPAQHQADQPILVEHVVEAFRAWATERAKTGSQQELDRAHRLCDELIKYEGKTPAEKFGPIKLQEQRARWIEAGISRRYVNKQVNLIARIFKHAVAQELVPTEVWQRLKSVEPLRAGATAARETAPREPVPIEVVRATAAHLSPVVRAILRVMVSTGMRPSEVCNLRPCDIDRSEEVWMFRPKHHKTAYLGKRKAVPIVGDARAAVEDYLNRSPESFLFSPKESVAWQAAQKRAARKSKVQPSQVCRKKPDPERCPSDRYTAVSLGRAVKRAAEAAGVPHWTPYQIRHLTGTAVRDALGLEAARAILGHSRSVMTETYTIRSEALAIEAAKVAPKL